MKEAVVEARFVALGKRAGEVRKVRWIGQHSAPDRLLLSPGGVWFVELKRPDKEPRPAQEREIDKLNVFRGVPFMGAISLNTIEGVENFYRRLRLI